MADKMIINIETDGTISVETDAVSSKNHHSADEFLKMVENLAGGTRNTKNRQRKHKHKHAAPHSH